MAGQLPGSSRMPFLGWVVVLMALVEGGWLAFDGAHALLTGDYVTPSSGEFAGQLGPWSTLVSGLGVEPRSTLMKSIHLLLGLAWLLVIAGFVRRLSWAWSAMMLCAVLNLWYLPFGTLLSLLQIGLLSTSRLRRGWPDRTS